MLNVVNKNHDCTEIIEYQLLTIVTALGTVVCFVEHFGYSLNEISLIVYLNIILLVGFALWPNGN